MEHGPLLVLQRISKRKPSASTALDLFDETALILESANEGRTWFIKEAQLLTRHSGIGRSYDALRHASSLTALIARNTVDEASRSAVGELLRAALTAFGSSARPDIVYFKSLYRFARDEGYPVKEQWFPTLPPADRAVAVTLLNRPLSEQSVLPAVVERLRRRLEEYLRGHTEIHLDPR